MGKLIHFWIMLVILISFKTSKGCSCIGKASVKQQIEKSQVVLVGKIISEKQISFSDSSLPGFKMYRNEYYLIVSSIYMGEKESDTIRIVTGAGKGDCGFKFEVGKKYIVYGDFENKYFPAAVSTVGMFLYTNICTRTMLYNENEEKEIKKNLE